LKSNLISKSETAKVLGQINSQWKIKLPKQKNLKFHHINENGIIITGDGITAVKIADDILPFLDNISILDILGRTVRSLVNEKVFEGETWQEILWDGKNDQKKQAPGGIYFCRILNGTTITQHKMILIK